MVFDGTMAKGAVKAALEEELTTHDTIGKLSKQREGN
jgi:hypothetical protein